MSVFEVNESDRARAEAHRREAERLALQTGLPAATGVREVQRVAVIGAGTMGGGIALAMAQAGLAVTLVDVDATGLQRGLARLRDTLETSVKRGRLEAAERDARLARIQGSVTLDDVAAADLVIEAVFEDMALKQDLYRRLDAIARPGAILATNTSGLDIDAIAAVTRRPQDVIGAHFFSPAHVMRLLEVVRARETADDVVATLMALAPRIGKTAVLARVYPGFIGNALFRCYNREAHFLVEDGALPHEVDAALTGFGFAMGIFAVHDMAGNDVGYPTRKAQIATRDNSRRWNDLILALVEAGRLGQKSGSGWYRYEPGDRRPHRDPELEAFVLRYAAERGIVRRPIGEAEILERCLYAMANEGARLLEKGVAMRPSDIDLVMLTGYGFPAAQGGPMFMADRIGLGEIARRVQALHAELGAWWEPAPLLLQLASEGRSFGQWQTDRAASRLAGQP